jgi:hypothetical protein
MIQTGPHTTPPSVTVYRVRFILMHFSPCISTTRETLERIDGCFFRATYSGKDGAYDLTAHYYSLLVRRNNRAESPMRLCTTLSVLKYTMEYLSFLRFQRVTTYEAN